MPRLEKRLVKDLRIGDVIYDIQQNVEMVDSESLEVVEAGHVVGKTVVVELQEVPKTGQLVLVHEIINLNPQQEKKPTAVILNSEMEVLVLVKETQPSGEQKAKPGMPKKRIDG